MKTTAKQVCKMCLDHMGLCEDSNCYRITIARFDKKSKFDINIIQFFIHYHNFSVT